MFPRCLFCLGGFRLPPSSCICKRWVQLADGGSYYGDGVAIPEVKPLSIRLICLELSFQGFLQEGRQGGRQGAAYRPSCSTRISGTLRILPLFAPRIVTMTTGRPVSHSVVPSVPPELSYSSTCSRTHWAGLGSYSSSRGIAFTPLSTRQAKGLTLEALGKLTGYSGAQISRYERGLASLKDVDVLRRFADALELPHQAFGLTPPAHHPEVRHGQSIGPITDFPRMPATRVGRFGREDGEDPVRRRKLLRGLAVAAAAAAGSSLLANGTATADEALLGELLVARIWDAMLGLGNAPDPSSAVTFDADFARALADFGACRYASLAIWLPRLIRSGHALTGSHGETQNYQLLAKSYLLATRMLIKMDEQQLGWMAADRARQSAEAGGDILTVAKSARQLAVLARKAGWHDEALSIALSAADHSDLRDTGRAGAAARGLLIQSAAYTVARRGTGTGCGS
ncbi:Helix-turn-helix domain-containing protein [Streptoalloteichus tenebrarius]|uniref:Helix-turn-helix domain-containing protein n=1 Tax=Streptoalloteichus tenebrarius (strain ATCC 17920 / DSM 40477 / JCM 4838 / CBS 697.72 / NBRC 16177 / NCIMB 11028 / NRRL B-12390 / A12253. 1 / ISP 5477) TaxID=1933 RepID=A0ABT1HWH5_STRSD|nr:Helix-turn-helix domain-containing protein [Streptoalloteichus tenebrarius]